jgi:hypothetical protein
VKEFQGGDLHELLRDLDQQMYQNKLAMKNRPAGEAAE